MLKPIDNRLYNLSDDNLIAGIELTEAERKKCLTFIGRPEQDLLNYLKNETICKRTFLVNYSTNFGNHILKIKFLDNMYCYRVSENVFVVYENQKFKKVDITGAIDYLREFLDDLVIIKILGIDKLDLRVFRQIN